MFSCQDFFFIRDTILSFYLHMIQAVQENFLCPEFLFRKNWSSIFVSENYRFHLPHKNQMVSSLEHAAHIFFKGRGRYRLF